MKEAEILELDLQQAYKLLTILKLDNPSVKDAYDLARGGIDHHFDIYVFLENNYTIKAKSNQAVVQGKAMSLEDFHTEKENREAIIKKALLDELADKDILTPRGVHEED